MKLRAYAVFIFGMMAPVLWHPLVFGSLETVQHLIHQTPLFYPLSFHPGYLAGIAVPFFIAGWLFFLEDRALVWQQRCILAFVTSFFGGGAHLISRAFFEWLAY